MCGISGIINRRNETVKQSEIKRINDLIVHRGPDDEGYYFGTNFAFGHRRLSVLDLSRDGHQPMHFQDKYTIIYNGEVYNYLEIREELSKHGYAFHSTGDTEVIGASYDKWGFDCVKLFNGMWAFALYDKTKDIIFCSRDRFGIKPFYYSVIAGKFVFGSEIKQLLEFYPTKYVNNKRLIDYLVAGLEDHTTETFFENIYKLEQAHNLIYDLKTHSFSIQQYYDIRLDKTLATLTEGESVSQYYDGLKNAIGLRLRSDVKVGTCLSGGLDSSAVAVVASEMYRRDSMDRFIAITAKSSEKANDESDYAAKVAGMSDLNWHIVQPKTADFVRCLDKVIQIQEEPFGSPSVFMQYFVFKKAKMLNCTVMLDGQGGDETLLGYERYYPAYLKSQPFFKFWKGFWRSYQNSKLSPKTLLYYMAYFTVPQVRIYRLRQLHDFIKKDYLDLLDTDSLVVQAKKYRNIFELQKQELCKTQLPHLLRYEDKNSMAHSIESRLPFLDYRLVETALSINNNYKIKDGWTKYLLRKSAETILPAEIVWRKNKFGFESPKSWLQDVPVFMKEIKKSEIIRNIVRFYPESLNTHMLWKLYNIARWEEIFGIRMK